MRSRVRASVLGVAGLGMLAGVSLAPVDAAAAEQVAVFEAELYDTSGEGMREDQEHRLVLITDQVRDALRASNRYQVVDTASVRANLAAGPSLRTCATCAPEAAAKLGADLALTTTVQKVSNLILSITMALREAAPSGATRAVYHAEIRGNSDASWMRGVSWLLRNRLLADARPAESAEHGR